MPKPKPEGVQVKEKVEDLLLAVIPVPKDDGDMATRRNQRRDRMQSSKDKVEDWKEKKEEISKAKDKKDEIPKVKREDVAVIKPKEQITPTSKGVKEETVKGKREEVASVKKEERKSTRKIGKVEEEKEEKDDKKPARGLKKEVKDDIQQTYLEESPKKRVILLSFKHFLL